MPTKPIDWLLNREFAKSAAEPVISIASPVLVEVVNHATTVFARCFASGRGEENEDVAPTFLHLHVVEMIDGVQALIAEACAVPAEPLLRSAFEAMISLQYIVADDYARRSLSWLYEYARSREIAYDILDPHSERGKVLRRKLGLEGANIPLPSSEDVSAAADPIRRFLARDQFAEIGAEFAECKRTRSGRNPAWHALFGGPDSIEQLASEVGESSIYQLIYRPWTKTSHGHDLSRFITQTPGGDRAVNPLRDPTEVAQAATLAVTIANEASLSLLGHFRPTEDVFGEWHQREVADSIAALSQFTRRRHEKKSE